MLGRHASVFYRHRPGDSFVHRLDPRVKVVAAVLFVLSNALLPDGAWAAFGLSLLFALAASAATGLGLGYAAARSLVVLPFVLAAVTTTFSVAGTPVAEPSLGPWSVTLTDAGLVRFASIVARALLSVQLMVLLTATTPFPDVLHALAHLRVPRLLVAVLSFLYRYLFVLGDEAIRLLRAREARSARRPGTPGGGTILWRARVAGNMVGQLFVRSYDRADRVHAAMLARGYRGHLMTLHAHAIGRGDVAVLALVVAALSAIQVVSRTPVPW